MRFWILKKDDSKKAELFTSINEMEEATYSYVYNKPFGGNIGDVVLLLEQIDAKWYFTYSMSITKSEKTENTLDKKNRNILKLRYGFSFAKARPLESFIFSLTAIKDYINPEKNFRKIREINEIEANSIFYELVYEKRTLLGITFYKSHIDHRKSMLNYLGINDFNQKYYTYDLEETLEEINKYLIFAIIEPAKQLLTSANILRRMAENDIYSNQLYGTINFSNENTEPQRSSNHIFNQVSIIEKYLNDLLKSINESKVKSNVENGLQNGFDKLFKKTPLILEIVQ